MRRLESAVPNHRLLHFFKRTHGVVGNVQGPKPAQGLVDLSEARKYSSALRDVTKIDQELVGKCLNYWLGLEAWRSTQKPTDTDSRGRAPQVERRDSGFGVGKI